MNVWWLLSPAAASAVLTGVMRRYALAHLVDVPNERSSHSLPTPRGGGVAIVVVFLSCLVALVGVGRLHVGAAAALLGGLAVALVGFIDDHQSVAPRWRLLAQLCAAVWALAWLSGMFPVDVLGVRVDLGWVGHLLAAVYLVWLINLYNFMDGIDGLAAVEAVTVSLGAAIVHAWMAPPGSEWVLQGLFAFATAGFLVWNWPPARIFMGDVGSGFLGFSLGVMSIQSGWIAPELFWSWMVLLGVFVVDATWTLWRRFVAGQTVHEPHRAHAYQHAARQLRAHRPVILAVAAINVFWLLPLALATASGRLHGLLALALAYGPLLGLALYFKAGSTERLTVAGLPGAH